MDFTPLFYWPIKNLVYVLTFDWHTQRSLWCILRIQQLFKFPAAMPSKAPLAIVHKWCYWPMIYSSEIRSLCWMKLLWSMVRKHSARGEMLGSARGWKKIHFKENPPYFFSIWKGNARECFLNPPYSSYGFRKNRRLFLIHISNTKQAKYTHELCITT